MRIEKIDYVPVQNDLTFALQVREWLTREVLPKCEYPELTAKYISLYGAPRLDISLELRNRFPNPRRPGESMSADVMFYVAVDHEPQAYEDPEGNVWTRSTVRTEVGWPSYPSSGSEVIKRRIEFFNNAMRLLEEFDAQFVNVPIWHLEMTKEKHDVFELEQRKLRIAYVIKSCLKTDLKGVRAGAPCCYIEGVPDGMQLEEIHDVEIDGKVFRAYRCNGLLGVRRIK